MRLCMFTVTSLTIVISCAPTLRRRRAVASLRSQPRRDREGGVPEPECMRPLLSYKKQIFSWFLTSSSVRSQGPLYCRPF